MPQLLVGNEQTGIGILHHEIQPLCRIAGIKRLIGTACLQHTQRGNDHPLATRNQHRDNIFRTQALRGNVMGDSLRNLVDLTIGVSRIMIDHTLIVGCKCGLTTEEGYDGLRAVIRHIGLVEAIENSRLRGIE